MTDREYGPSRWQWVADQVEAYEGSDGAQANTFMDMPIIVMTTAGHRSGLLRKVPLMRVEHDGEYGIIASKGGAPSHPAWFYNLVANPNVQIQDGDHPTEYKVEQLSGDARAQWFARGVEAYPPYAEYEVSATEAGREIPVFVARPV